MKTQKQQGFTIIEVVLVLAIAGLIFLIVFLAVPALQRSQRDTARRNDVSRFMAAVSSYQANAKGAVPAASAAGTTALGAYLVPAGSDDTFADPGGSNWTYVYGAGAIPTDTGVIRYATTGRCSTTVPGEISAGTGARQVAASVKLEGGGGYCQQN